MQEEKIAEDPTEAETAADGERSGIEEVRPDLASSATSTRVNSKKRAAPSTPPASPPRNNATIFKEWIQRVVHKISPRRGRSTNPKKKDLAHQAWELRNEECNGLVLVSRANEDGSTIHSGRCSVCKKKTNMFCTGCKRFLCVDKDRSRDIGDDITNITDTSVSLYKFQQTQIDQRTGEETMLTFYATRSCYHMVHEAQFDRILSQRGERPSEYERVANPNVNLLGRFDEAAENKSQNIIPTDEE